MRWRRIERIKIGKKGKGKRMRNEVEENRENQTIGKGEGKR